MAVTIILDNLSNMAMNGHTLMAGVDEAGRGALAGPVYAAAVILNPALPIEGLMDSKQLSAKKRETLAVFIQQRSLAWAVASAHVDEIDTLNILQASLLAMQRAVDNLPLKPQLVIVDGRDTPVLNCPVQALIKGDQLEPAISAASILAKVYRDNVMRELDKHYPQYGFAVHKGYGTAKHLAALQRCGVCNEHRRSYAPVHKVLLAQTL